MRWSVLMLLLFALGGCSKAARYEARAQAEAARQAEARRTEELLPAEIQWIDILHPPSDTSIKFVHIEKDPQEWAALKKFWNAPPLDNAAGAAALIGMPALAADALALASRSSEIKIKVPLGLPDPRDFVPEGNPVTLGKWQLGQRLFFDNSWLEAKPGVSCATCHQPEHGFADLEHAHAGGFNAPSLINCVFNRWQFWDGRVANLEEVVQRSLDDEREAEQPKPFRHTWSGVIRRLRNKANYHEQFNRVFGKPSGEENEQETTNITQDTVGRALATYLRTILGGDSLHDRARRAQEQKRDKELTAKHYQAVLEDADLIELGREKAKKTEVAAELLRGYWLFHGLDATRPLVNCSHCHNGPNFTDSQFHNIGVGFSSPAGREGGRFAQVPIGRKNRYLIDAYKTPSLRNLLRTGPYFHDGKESRLEEVIDFYDGGAGRNIHLDPALRGKEGQTRLLSLNEADKRALVLFLRALNGREVDGTLRRAGLR